MAIKFYYLSGSPFGWKVWLALERKRIDYEMVLLSADGGDLKQPGFLAINPRGKVPAISDDGYNLYESSAICEYLDERYADSGAGLWPGNLCDRATGRRMESEVGAYIYPPLRRLVEELLFRREGIPDEAAISSAREALASELNLFAQAAVGDFLLGHEPSLADFALYPMTALLDRLDLRHPQRAFSGLMPEPLKSWSGRVEALSYFQKTVPPHWRAG
ncbi:glutathione S-transferase family protein [Candidatus Methylospira mobilis]|nr:glutathione S-transferase family protein [Candidatus Methylospira mobilis]WNV03005.1 glutathione S-transferase family protein [Candidatus Methylospira mobilis]